MCSWVTTLIISITASSLCSMIEQSHMLGYDFDNLYHRVRGWRRGCGHHERVGLGSVLRIQTLAFLFCRIQVIW